MLEEVQDASNDPADLFGEDVNCFFGISEQLRIQHCLLEGIEVHGFQLPVLYSGKLSSLQAASHSPPHQTVIGDAVRATYSQVG